VIRRYLDLPPDTQVSFDGWEARTLPRPAGELLARVVTVNDVHFGEIECGHIDDSPLGPILTAEPGGPPYPQVMNDGAAAEIAAVAPDAVIVKGDISASGHPEEFAAFESVYGRFGDRLHSVRGNHDAIDGQREYSGEGLVELPGVRIALIDTTRPGHPNGWLRSDQLDWLDTVAADSDRSVLVMGHHHPWLGGKRADDYFGIKPEASDRLVEVIARRPRIAGYFAGHTHRNRVRRHGDTGALPYVEVACVKDFPGSWAEYRVFEGGILQVHHRISTPDALAWSDRCRVLYRDFGIDYVAYAFGTLADRCFAIPAR
jgi:predicted phosphodiesterase